VQGETDCEFEADFGTHTRAELRRELQVENQGDVRRGCDGGLRAVLKSDCRREFRGLL
jgi:hypothetical protein